MNPSGTAIVLTDNNRSGAYLQNLVRFGFAPQSALVLGKRKKPATHQRLCHSLPGFQCTLQEKESVFDTLEQAGIPSACLKDADINSPQAAAHVAGLAAHHVIYSGPAGVLLRQGILRAGKAFVHMHPGLLPAYKGSTTTYYSMLLEKKLGCSIFIMNEGIDSGDILFQKEYPLVPQPVDYDTVVDPLVRAETLIALMQLCHGDLSAVPSLRQADAGHTFYIIHPVLKHLALLNGEGAN